MTVGELKEVINEINPKDDDKRLFIIDPFNRGDSAEDDIEGGFLGLSHVLDFWWVDAAGGYVIGIDTKEEEK